MIRLTIVSIGISLCLVQTPGASAASDPGRLAEVERGGGQGTVRSRVLVMLGYFGGQPTPAQSPTELRQLFFGPEPSVADFYWENSFGRFALSGEVTPWFRLVGPSTCNVRELTSMAMVSYAAVAPELNFLDYHYFVVVASYDNPGCPDGQALIGPMKFETPDGPTRAGRAILRTGTVNLFSAAHELGHTFGLHHAGLLACDLAVQADEDCGYWEYGDHFDIMGGDYQLMGGHLNALHKDQFNWLRSRHQTVTQSGIWTIDPYIRYPAGLQALFLDRGDGTRLSVEYRQPFGYDRALADPTVFQGGLIHLSGAGGQTFLVDPTPPAYIRSNSLLAGQRWSDYESGLTLQVLSALPSGLTLRVLVPRTVRPVPIVPVGDYELR